MRINCPHCHNGIDLVDRQMDEVVCPGCGSSVRITEAPLPTTDGHVRRLGKFELLERVGIGAFGAVFRARDTELKRTVAIKLAHPSLLDSTHDRERFLREARAAAQLRHPGIVAIHEALELDGYPAIVSDFVEGLTLREFLETKRLTFDESAQLVSQVASALHYAHVLGIFHRDIKPANIMIELAGLRTGDENADLAQDKSLRPLLLDFGLALRPEAEITLTIDGQIIGTPAYMCPEQAAGTSHRVDARSDVYSLGVVLYELLTGEIPFRGSKVMMIHQVLREAPRPPRKLNDRVPRDLETICLKAISKSPSRRYVTAKALADDLQRYLNREPIAARPVGQAERVLLWCGRNPVVAALTATIAIILAVATVVSLYYAWSANSRAIAERIASRAANANFYAAEMNLAQRDWESSNISALRRRLDRTLPEGTGGEDIRRFEWYYWRNLCQSEITKLEEFQDEVLFVGFSSDDRLIAHCYGGPFKSWVPGVSQELQLHQHAGFPTAMSGNGQWIATAMPNDQEDAISSLRLWNTVTNAITELKPPSPTITSLALTDDGSLLLVASSDMMESSIIGSGSLQLLDIRENKSLFTIRTDSKPLGSMIIAEISPNARYIAWCDFMTDTVALAKITSREPDVKYNLKSLRVPGVVALAFSPDSETLAIAGWDGDIELFDAESGVEIAKLAGHDGPVNDVCFSPDGRLLASCGDDQNIRIWSTQTYAQTKIIRGHEAGVQKLVFSRGGGLLASGSSDKTVRLWRIRHDQRSRSIFEDRGFVYDAAFSPNGKLVVSAGMDGVVRLWDADSGAEISALRDHSNPVYCVAFSPSGALFASGGMDSSIRLWDVAVQREVAILEGHKGMIRHLAFSPDGRHLISASKQLTGDEVSHIAEIKVWDIETGSLVVNSDGRLENMPFDAVGFTQNGKPIAVGVENSRLKAVDVRSGELIVSSKVNTLQANDSGAGLAVDRNGKYLAVVSGEQSDVVQIIDLDSGQQVHELNGHTHVKNIGFSADGYRIATTSEDGTIKIWCTSNGRELLTLEKHTGYVFSACFSPDCRMVISTGEDGIKVWDARDLDTALMTKIEAVSLLQQLFSLPLLPVEVIDRISNSGALDENLRSVALEFADRWPADPGRINDLAWSIAMRSDATESEYERANKYALVACELDPDNGMFRNTLGATLYRLGEWQNAIELLLQSTEMNKRLAPPKEFNFDLPSALDESSFTPESHPADVAFLALARYHAGDTSLALQGLEELKQVSKRPPWDSDQQVQNLLKEAESVISTADPSK